MNNKVSNAVTFMEYYTIHLRQNREEDLEKDSIAYIKYMPVRHRKYEDKTRR